MILTLLSYNIHFGGAGREPHLSAVIKEVEPDIVVFQEATIPRVIERLAEATGMSFWDSKPNHSLAYCSKIEIEHHEWHYHPGSKHAFLEIVPAGTTSRIFGLHLRAMFSKWGERRRALEIQHLLAGIQKHQEGFHVLTGDFNSLAPGELLDTTRMPRWIQALVWISGRDIQRHTVQAMRDKGYTDGYRTLNPDDPGYTFPTRDPHVRLDYVFLPVVFVDRLKECVVVQQPPAFSASDHFPLLSRLDIP